MSTLKDNRYIKDLHRSLLKYTLLYKKSKIELRRLIQNKRDCTLAGYTQHYPEFNSMIGESLSRCKILKKQLRVTADTLSAALKQIGG